MLQYKIISSKYAQSSAESISNRLLLPERTFIMIFVPLLHYFKCKNIYSGNEYGLRYRLTPGKRSVPDPDGGEGATKEESILTLDYWPDPWTLEKTDPALRVQKIFPLTDEGRAMAAKCLQDAFNADPDGWKNCPDMMDCDPWEPPAEPAEEEPKE